MHLLPLFPLRRVLVPGEAAMLHVFEPRYREMFATLDDDRFGIVLIKSGPEVGESVDVHRVGTVAEVIERRDLDDGRIVLAAVGRHRFEIVDRLPDAPYPSATVVFLGEGDEPSGNLVDDVRASLRRYMVVSAEAGEGGDVHIDISSNPVQASYQVASAVRLAHPERQELLELPTAADRLERERRMLEREVDLLERLIQES